MPTWLMRNPYYQDLRNTQKFNFCQKLNFSGHAAQFA